jgi:hypothetical protein
MVVQIFKEKEKQPSYGQQLLGVAGRQLRSFGEQMPALLEKQAKTKAKEFEKKQKEDALKQKAAELQKGKYRSQLPRSFKSYSQDFGFDKSIDEETRRGLLHQAENLLDQGYDPLEAVHSVYDSYLKGVDEESIAGESKAEKEEFNVLKAMGGLSTHLPEIKKGVSKLFQARPEKAPEVPRKNIAQQLANVENNPREYNKLLSSLSREEFLALPREQQIAISKDIGQNIVPQEVERSIAQGILGKNGVQRIAEAGGLPELEFAPPGGEATGELFGQLLRDLGIFKGAGQIEGLVPRALAAGGGLAGAKAVEKGLEGEAPTIKDVAPSFAYGAGAELAAPIFGKLFQYLGNKFKRPVKIPEILKEAEVNVAEGPPRPPKIKEIEFKPPKREFKVGEVPPEPSPGPVTTAEAKTMYNNVIDDAVKNLSQRGITVEAINRGEPAALNALGQEAEKLANIYKEADKLNIKALAKQRADIEKKLIVSPLEKYYVPAKEVTHTPERIAAEAIRIEPLEKQIKEQENKLRELQYSILKTDNLIRSGELTEEQIGKLRSNRDLDALAHARALNEIKNARFEIKYGRPPQTTESIQNQIDKTFTELRDGLKNPDAKKVGLFKKGLERDRHLIEQANKLIARGEIPGPEVFDEYIKIHEQYLRNYDALIKELTDFIAEHKNKARTGAKVQRAEDLLNLIKDTKKVGDAKVAIQKDKRRVQGILDKPSGVFYKQMLKELRKDVDAFQKDYFKWYKIAEGPHAKISEIGKKSIKPLSKVEKTPFMRKTLEAKEPPKVKKRHLKEEVGQKQEFEKAKENAEKAAKNPTSENTEAAGKASDMSEEEIKDYMDKISEKIKNAKAKAKTGTITPKDEKNIFDEVMSIYKRFPRLAKTLINGTVLGAVQGLLEENTGWKPTQTQVGLISSVAADPKKIGLRGGHAGVIAALVYQQIHNAFDHSAESELKNKRGKPKEFDAYFKKLKEHYGETRANRIRKKAIQS